MINEAMLQAAARGTGLYLSTEEAVYIRHDYREQLEQCPAGKLGKLIEDLLDQKFMKKQNDPTIGLRPVKRGPKRGSYVGQQVS